MLCGEKMGRNVAANSGAKRCVRKPENGSGGPTMANTSGRMASSVENVRVNWSSNDLRGSTFVGDKHVSNTDFGGSADKLNDCFFLPLDIIACADTFELAVVDELMPAAAAALLGVLLTARNNFDRRSFASLSRGGLPVLVFICGSELGASGSVCAFSLPELSFRHSEPPLSKHRDY